MVVALKIWNFLWVLCGTTLHRVMVKLSSMCGARDKAMRAGELGVGNDSVCVWFDSLGKCN